MTVAEDLPRWELAFKRPCANGRPVTLSVLSCVRLGTVRRAAERQMRLRTYHPNRAMTTPRPGDSFGTFLKVLHGEQPTRDDRDEIALGVVRILSEGGPAGLADLRKAAGADPALFWPALQNLMEAKLVQDIGTADAELLALTEVGMTVASLARRESS